MPASDLRFAVRALYKRPGFSLVAIATLALGIGATTAIFSVANGVLLKALPYPDADRIVMVWEEDLTDPSGELGGSLSHVNVEDIQAQARTLEAVANVRTVNIPLTGLGEAEMLQAGSVTPDLFRVFGQELVMGRSFTEAEDLPGGPYVTVISHTFWQTRLGGRSDVLGATLELNGRPVEIVGVAPPGFDYPRNVPLWVPLKNDNEGCGRGCVLSQAVARLAPGATVEQANLELSQIAARLRASEVEDPASVVNLGFVAAGLHHVMVGDVRSAVWILFGAVAMVLLIACANVANLVLVRGGARRTEIAVRSALGAGRGRILAQLMTENLVLAGAGAVGGLILAAWGVAALTAAAPAALPRVAEVGLDPLTLLFALSIAVVTLLVFGLAPALRIAGEGLADTLRRGDRSAGVDRRGNRMRAAVLVAEVALSIMLLLGAGLMLRSLARMHAVELGLETEGVAHFRLSLPAARYADEDAVVLFLEELDGRLEQIPGVRAASISAAVPFTTTSIFGGFTRSDLPEPEPGQGPVAAYRYFDADALEVLGAEVVSGRTFTAADRWGAQPVVMINEQAAEEFWPGVDPVGRQLDVQVGVGYDNPEPKTVVGVVRDFRRSVTEAPVAELYVPLAQAGPPFPTVLMKVDEGMEGAALAAARRTLAELDPALPMAANGTLAELVAEDLAAPTFYMTLLGLFALLALALAAVGIYGVVAYLVVQRTREIGVRMALGARVDEVIRLVVWQGLRPALTGVGLGVLASLAMGRGMASILFDVPVTDPLTYLAASMLLVAVVVAATAVPALRAARIPPARALRND